MGDNLRNNDGVAVWKRSITIRHEIELAPRPARDVRYDRLVKMPSGDNPKIIRNMTNSAAADDIATKIINKGFGNDTVAVPTGVVKTGPLAI